MMGGAMYIRMRGVDLIILCLKFAVLRRKIGPNTLSCTCLTTNGILVSHRIILILARPSIVFLSVTHKAPTIAKILEAEGIKASRRGIFKFIKC